MVKLEHKTFGTIGSAEEPVMQKEQEKENDLRSLIELGCVTDTVTIDDKVFELSTIHSSKKLELAGYLNGENPSTEMLFNFNIKTLASAINSVNGVPLENFHPKFKNGATPEAIDQLRCEIISSMQSPVIGKLLTFYNEISERSETQYDAKQVKN
jgi:hypothetical protein